MPVTSNRDPAGLLQRLPELQSLCSEPSVARAVASGDTFKVYRALAWARWTGKLGAQRATVDRLLASRRAFAKPLKGTPSLGSVNSVGFTFLGKSEEAPDGTWIASHAFAILFKVPLFVLGSYVVSYAGRSGLTTNWQIFAKVPMSVAAWAWSRLLLAGAAAAVLAGAFGIFWASRHHDVYVVNGLPRRIQVTVGEKSLWLGPGQFQAVNLELGTHAVRAATERGEVIDEGKLEVASGSDVRVWDVAGAAPVAEEQVVYAAGAPPPSPEPVIHCGERQLSLRSVDFVFREAPDQISLPKGQNRSVKRAVYVAKTEEDGAQACTDYLETRNADAAEAVKRARALVVGE